MILVVLVNLALEVVIIFLVVVEIGGGSVKI